MTDIDFEMDKLKISVLSGSNSAFYGTILGSLNFEWKADIPTAHVTDTGYLRWNPDWFLQLPGKTRKTVLMHELRHVANLHFLRAGGRRLEEWAIACDYEVNNTLKSEGYTFDGTKPIIGDGFEDMSAEQIYDVIMKNPDLRNQSTWGIPEEGTDLIEEGAGPDSIDKSMEHLSIVTKALQVAKSVEGTTDSCGPGGGFYDEYLNKFLRPKLHYSKVLRKYFTRYRERNLSWKKRNRRFNHVYLPSYVQQQSSLEHVVFYRDSSGSMSDEEIIRFNSEVKHIKDLYRPDNMTLVQFNTGIVEEVTFTKKQKMHAIRGKGCGGTSFACVREHILNTKPTVAVIFSDMLCSPMESVGDIPVIWIAINNPHIEVPFGTLLHIQE